MGYKVVVKSQKHGGGKGGGEVAGGEGGDEIAGGGGINRGRGPLARSL